MRQTAALMHCAVLGDPIAHSLSPALHNSAYAALGLDWVYVAFPVPAGSGAAAVEAMRTLGLAGLSVTMPHKQAMCAHVDELRDNGRRVGAINAARRLADGRWVGDMFDGLGYVGALRRHARERTVQPSRQAAGERRAAGARNAGRCPSLVPPQFRTRRPR